MWYFVVGGVCLATGFVGCFFVMRNNKKWFDADDIIKGKRDELLGDLGDAVKKRVNTLTEIL